MAAPPKRVPLRKIVPKPGDRPHDVAKQIQDNVEDALNKMAAANQFGFVPIGFILWCDLSLPGVPAPPANWVQCNGQKVTDQKSPLYGQTLRDINKAGNFIRGSTVSGTVQASDAIVPAHAHSMQAHTHTGASLTFTGGALPTHAHTINSGSTAGLGTTSVGASNSVGTYASGNNTTAPAVTGTVGGSTGGPSVANTASDGGSGAETRPKNVSMVAYIRIW